MPNSGHINRADSWKNRQKRDTIIAMLKHFRNMYSKTMHWARTEKALAMIAFAESSFFPIPPDPILLNMVLEKPKKWLRYTGITSVSSVVGGVVGYFIGVALFASIGDWVLNTYALHDQFDQLGDLFERQGMLAVFAAALTPIPYKIFTISAGAFKLNFFVFLIASILGRTLRFAAVAFAGQHFGKKYEDQIGKYIDRISLGIIGGAVLAIALYSLIH